MGRRLTFIVLVGAAAIAAALYAPSWVDHRQSPQFVLSARVVNFDVVRIGTPVEHLITVRNDGHATITSRDGGGIQRHFNSVCPRRLGRVQRMTNCGLSIWPADECQTLKPGATCAVAIHFTPRTPKPYSARFCFDYVATSQNWRQTGICLTATGIGARGTSRPAR